MLRLLVVSFVLLILAACSGAESRSREHMDLGDRFYEQADYQKARLEYKNVLQIEPENAAAFFALGKTMEQLQDIRSAVANFRRVVELDPKHVDARVRLAYIYLAAQAKDEARKLDDEGLALDPENAELLALRGNIKSLDGDIEGALADGQAALARDPSSAQAVGLLAAIYRRQDKPREAIALLEQGVERNPDSAPLKLVLVNAYVEQGNDAAAVSLYRNLIRQYPDRLAYRLQLARFQTQQKLPGEAERTLREAIDVLPQSMPAKLALVEFLYDVRGKDPAETELRSLVTKQPKELILRSALASLYEKSGEPGKASEIYRELISLDGEGEEGVRSRTRLARLLLKDGGQKEAEALVDEVIRISPTDGEALTLHGQFALESGDAAGAITDFRTVLKDQPNSVPVLRLLAKAHLVNNEGALARDEMRKAIDLAPNDPQLRLELAQIDLQGGDTASARDQLSRVLDVLPKHPDALAAMFRISLAEQDLPGAHQYARTLKSAYPDSALGYYLAGQAYQAERKFAQSEQEYENALARSSPAELQPLAGLVAVHLLQGQRDKALARIDRALETAPKSPLLRNMKGELLMGGQKFEAARAMFTEAIELDPSFTLAYRNLALARLGLGDKDGAVAAYHGGIEANPGNPVLTTQLASLYEGLGRYDDAIGLYRAALEREPESLMASNNLAMLLATYRDDEKSLAQAEQLTARLAASDNPNYLDTAGWVSYRRGNIDTAIAVLEQAVARAPDSPVIRYHLGKAYRDKGNAEQARLNLERALQRPEPFTGKDDAKAIFTALADS